MGREQIISEELQPANKVKYWYNRKSIFDLQFPQYNPIIHALADREDKDWVIIAWTYIQYFLWNQRNIKWDWMLSDFWKKTSDWDLCKLYWRLKKDNVRYLIVDPNIGTVTMWEWNETLFYRFFAKLNGDGTNIEKDGTITTLIRLAKTEKPTRFFKIFSKAYILFCGTTSAWLCSILCAGTIEPNSAPK